MKRLFYLLIFTILLIIPINVNAHYKPTTIKNKEDFIYFVRYYNGSQCKIDKNIVILEKDLVFNVPISFNLNKSFTLDLNGHNIINKKSDSFVIVNNDNNKLLKIINSNKKESYIKSIYNTFKINKGNLIIDNVKIVSSYKNYNGVLINGGKTKLINDDVFSKGNALTLNRGYLQVESGNYYGNYGLNIKNGNAVINGGLFEGNLSGLMLNNPSSLHLKNGEFSKLKKHNTIKNIKDNLYVSMIIYRLK